MDRNEQEPGQIPGLYVLALFAGYLLAQLLFFPFLFFAYYYLKEGIWLSNENFDAVFSGWVQVSAMVFASLIVFVIFSFFRPHYRQYIWNTTHQEAKKRLRNLLIGAGSAIVIYPVILLLSALINQLLKWTWGLEPQEQDVVSFFKQTESDPLLMGCMIMMIALVVPIVEEMLFRGGLQRWLMRYCSVGASILVTGFIFALFHFSWDQGITNISLLISLMVLGWTLGYLYQKRGSLWASIGLHMTFNAISVLMILFLPDL